MVLVTQPKTAGFKPKSRYDIHYSIRRPALKVLICVSPKHGMHASLRCLKILYIHDC